MESPVSVTPGAGQDVQLDWNKPIALVKNNDGSTSSVRTISIDVNGKEVLIPTVSKDGRIMSNEEATQHYYNTGENFGKYDTIEEANKAGEALHIQQENLNLGDNPKYNRDDLTTALAGNNIDLRGLSPEDIQTMLSGGLGLGKMRADQVIAQQAGLIAERKDAVANAKLALDEKKANIQQELAEKRITAQEARDRANQADRDAQIAISQGMLGVAMRNADIASNRADNANAPKPTSPAQQLEMDTQIAGIGAAIASGKDSKGNSLDPASLDSYVALYNKHSPGDKYVKTPDTPPKVIGGREVPFTGEKGGYVKVSKTGTGSAPAGALELLKKNPALKDQFKKKYGYLPEGY